MGFVEHSGVARSELFRCFLEGGGEGVSMSLAFIDRRLDSTCAISDKCTNSQGPRDRSCVKLGCR